MGKLFNFFSGYSNKDGKGISEEEVKKLRNLNFVNFFKLFGMKFSNIVKGNGLFLLCNFPIMFAIYASAGYHDITTRVPADLFYPNLYGVMQYEGVNAASAALNSIFGRFAVFYAPSTTTYVIYAISLLCLFTFGLANAGLNYLMRESVRSKPTMVWHDFWDAIKKNWKQCLIIGIIDLSLIIILIFDLIEFYRYSGDITGTIGFTTIIVLIFIYIIMRNYLYMLSISFSYKLKKIFNYSFRLVLLGMKRNILAILGMALVVYLNFLIGLVNPPLGLLLPFIFTIGICSFIGAYTAWPVIEKYLVEDKDKKDSNVVYEYIDYEDDEEGDEEEQDE